MSPVASYCPMMMAEPSGVHVSPRMRGPIGRSATFRYGAADVGSTIQTDVTALVG